MFSFCRSGHIYIYKAQLCIVQMLQSVYMIVIVDNYVASRKFGGSLL